MSLMEKTISLITPQCQQTRHLATERLSQLTMPHWALGDLMDLAVDLAGMCGTMSPRVKKKRMFTIAGDHGVATEGVSKYPQEVTAQMVINFLNKGAAVNAFASVVEANVMVVNMGVATPINGFADRSDFVNHPIAMGTQNIVKGPAMTRDQAVSAIEMGIHLANTNGSKTDLFGTGDMGIGNTTASSAIGAVITGCQPNEIAGRGTGINDDQLANKIKVITQSIATNKPDSRDPIDILTKVGGFEIGGICGLILGAAALKKPVVIDGFISAAGALLAQLIHRDVVDYCVGSHLSAESGHEIMLNHLGIKPLFDFNFRLGEGTGALLAMNLVEASVSILTDIATFESANISKSAS